MVEFVEGQKRLAYSNRDRYFFKPQLPFFQDRHLGDVGPAQRKKDFIELDKHNLDFIIIVKTRGCSFVVSQEPLTYLYYEITA